ncbi:hypothetical protein EE612_031034 [Oryza sativa]|nr:hypothetical protein EE612_031034 [Oryza sativa]
MSCARSSWNLSRTNSDFLQASWIFSVTACVTPALGTVMRSRRVIPSRRRRRSSSSSIVSSASEGALTLLLFTPSSSFSLPRATSSLSQGRTDSSKLEAANCWSGRAQLRSSRSLRRSLPSGGAVAVAAAAAGSSSSLARPRLRRRWTIRSMEEVGEGARGGGGGAAGSVGPHFCSHGAPRVGFGAGGARLPPEEEEEEEEDAAAVVEEEEEAWREERRRSGRRRRWGREERRKEWWSGSSESAMDGVWWGV